MALASAAAVLAAACGPAATPATPPHSDGAAGTLASDEPIKIGFVWGVTGAIAEIVRPASEATHAYFDDLNAHGGINGRPVQMVEIDSKYQVPLAQEGYKQVTTEDNVPLVVLASTGDTEALAPQINADQVAAVTFSCDEKWAKPQLNPYVFTICTTYQDQMSTALRFVKERGDGANPSVAFAYPDIPFGQAPIPAGREYARSLGLPLVDEQKVGAADLDAQSQALSLKSSNPDYVVIQNVAGGASATVRSGKQVGLRSQFLGLNYAFDEATIQAIGPQAADGYIGVGPNAFPGPDVAVVQEMHQRAPRLKEINMRSIVGWTLASVIADALRHADGSTGPAIKQALEGTDLDVKGAIPGSRWTYTAESHVPTRKSVFYQVKSGRIERISDPIDPPAR
ncbi:MAG: ABC transporter substrate-binding protein [Chloroflexi bacterium]|nr:ABC transporter substrate-binding protein [Chloroflexota bacterium]